MAKQLQKQSLGQNSGLEFYRLAHQCISALHSLSYRFCLKGEPLLHFAPKLRTTSTPILDSTLTGFGHAGETSAEPRSPLILDKWKMAREVCCCLVSSCLSIMTYLQVEFAMCQGGQACLFSAHHCSSLLSLLANFVHPK